MVWGWGPGHAARPAPRCRHTHLGRYTVTLFGALTKLSQP